MYQSLIALILFLATSIDAYEPRTYDNEGQLIHLQDADGGWIAYTYDEEGRLHSKETPDDLMHYHYDQRGHPLVIGDFFLVYDQQKRVIRIENDAGFYEVFVYNDDGLPIGYDETVSLEEINASPTKNSGIVFVGDYAYHLLLDIYLNEPLEDPSSLPWQTDPCITAWSVLPKIRSPVSYGHSWISITDCLGITHTYEAFPEGMKKNATSHPPKAVSHSWKVTDLESQAVIAEMEAAYRGAFIYHFARNNCIHLLRKGLKIAHIPHPDFISEMKIPLPCCVCKYINLLNRGFTPRDIAKKYQKFPKEYTPVGTKNSLKKLK